MAARRRRRAEGRPGAAPEGAFPDGPSGDDHRSTRRPRTAGSQVGYRPPGSGDISAAVDRAPASIQL